MTGKGNAILNGMDAGIGCFSPFLICFFIHDADAPSRLNQALFHSTLANL